MNPLFPAFLLQTFSPATAQHLLEALQTQPPVSIRLRPSRSTFFADAESVPWCPEGRYLPSRPSFTLDPLFHAGAYYVQEAASMYLWQTQKIMADLADTLDRPLRVLDLCAAPGGKTTLLADILPAGSLLVANEVIRTRVGALVENVSKWGTGHTVITNNDPKDFTALPGWFDVILVDAPCSGEGLFRKDPAAAAEWSPTAVQHCAARQRRILADILPALAPGGLLLYSTCTYNHFEDEDQVAWLTSAYGLEPVMPISAAWQRSWGLWGNSSHPGCVKFIPGFTRSEGFFCSLLRNPQEKENLHPAYKNGPVSAKKKGSKQGEEKGYTPLEGDWVYRRRGDMLQALPMKLHADMTLLENSLRVAVCGLAAAEQKGCDWQPLQDLAHARNLKPDFYPRAELDSENALHFLRRNPITLPAGTPKGYVIITFRNQALGFVKNIGVRSNNLFPASRRIRLS